MNTAIRRLIDHGISAASRGITADARAAVVDIIKLLDARLTETVACSMCGETLRYVDVFCADGALVCNQCICDHRIPEEQVRHTPLAVAFSEASLLLVGIDEEDLDADIIAWRLKEMAGCLAGEL